MVSAMNQKVKVGLMDEVKHLNLSPTWKRMKVVVPLLNTNSKQINSKTLLVIGDTKNFCKTKHLEKTNLKI